MTVPRGRRSGLFARPTMISLVTLATLATQATMPTPGHAAPDPDRAPAAPAAASPLAAPSSPAPAPSPALSERLAERLAERASRVGRRVLLVVPEPAADLAAAVLTRLRGELRAASFDLDVMTIGAEAPRRSTVEDAAVRGGASAALGIFFAAGRVEMWATDASAGRTLMQNLPLDGSAPERRAAVVAVKAVDLLKALLADIWNAPAAVAVAPTRLPPDAAPTTGPDTTIGVVHQPPTMPRERFALTAGAGWLQNGTASGWAPTASLSAALGAGRVGLRVAVSGLGPAAGVNETSGSARLTQEIGLVELLAWSREWRRLRGLLALGAGAHHLSVEGHGNPGFAGVNHEIWSTATSAGAGITLDVVSRLVVALDARAIENWPATTVQIDGTRAARIGRPIVWVALGAGVRFP
jgi:hypothetical protein